MTSIRNKLGPFVIIPVKCSIEVQNQVCEKTDINNQIKGEIIENFIVDESQIPRCNDTNYDQDYRNVDIPDKSLLTYRIHNWA